MLEPVGPDRPLTEADRRAGVVWDRQVHFGVHDDGPVLRVEANGDVFHLETTQEDLSAELIGLIYRQRWQIELFFKWRKMNLNCRHWLAESREGVESQNAISHLRSRFGSKNDPSTYPAEHYC